MKYLINNETYYWEDEGYQAELESGKYLWVADSNDDVRWENDNPVVPSAVVLYWDKDGTQLAFFGSYEDFLKKTDVEDVEAVFTRGDLIPVEKYNNVILASKKTLVLVQMIEDLYLESCAESGQQIRQRKTILDHLADLKKELRASI